MSKKKQEKLTAPLALFKELEGSIPRINLDGISEAKKPVRTNSQKTPPGKE